MHKSCSKAKPRIVGVFASKSGGFPLNWILKRCKTCGGKGAIECPRCKESTYPLQGLGKKKKNGNIFERWKCFDCQGFGLKSWEVVDKTKRRTIYR